MKHIIRNRWTGETQVEAEIDCADYASDAVKLGLAVVWAVKNRASLYGTSLDGANLDGANLNRASLYGASLYGASLDGASLYGAILNRASLDGASLYGAILNRASLDGASLDGANLYGANLYGANLDGANLNRASGINDWIKFAQIERYAISYTAEMIQIGCQRHTHAEWAAFTDAEIRAMDGKAALDWWGKYKDWLFATIALCPAQPTGYVAEGAAA